MTAVRAAASVAAVALLGATTGTVAVATTPPSAPTLQFKVQAMDGDLHVAPGAIIEVGYDFAVPGPHPAEKVWLRHPAAVLTAACLTGGGGGTITVPANGGPFELAAADGGWQPSGDQNDAQTFQGSKTVPDLCAGGAMSLRAGGSFSATPLATDTSDSLQARWHYAVVGSSQDGWSATQSVLPGPRPGATPPAEAPGQLVVKIDTADGYSIEDVTSAFPVQVVSGGLASRGIYLLDVTDPQQQDPHHVADLAGKINRTQGVVYAEPNLAVQLADTQFHAWPYGHPRNVSQAVARWSHQPVVRQLQLATAHQQSRGKGVIVAVLDTGADRDQAVLHGHLVPGWNYVADNSDIDDVADASGHAAVGHGTFVCGLIRLVAPQARILPERVLDGAGFGTDFAVAQAISDAVAAGAKVINLSFGTPQQLSSHLLQDAIQQAQQAGVTVVAAAGNDADNQPHFPAAQPPTLSVGALSADGGSLAPFSDFGPWVDLAAPGEQLVGPLPDDRFATWAGTSMAAPIVAGQTALLLAEAPTLSTGKVDEALEHTATAMAGHVVHFGAVDVPASLAYAQTHP